MAIAHVQSATVVEATASSANPSITITGTVGGNALCVECVMYSGNGTYTLGATTDGGNSFTTRSGVATSGSNRIYAVAAHAENITGGSRTITVAFSGTAAGTNYWGIGVTEKSGVATTFAEDASNHRDDIDITAADITGGSITTTDAGDLIFGVAATLSTDSTHNWASPTSWTNRYRRDNGTTNQAFDGGDWLPGSIQTGYSPQWAHDNTTAILEGCGVVVALRAVGAPVRVTLANNLLKCYDLAPILRNDNVANSYKRDKVGPHSMVWDGVQWRGYFEVVDGTVDYNPGNFRYPTGVVLATAPALQGPWTISPLSRIVDPTISDWENRECSPSACWWDAANNRWIVWYHGGNNDASSGRSVGVMYSTDGIVGMTFARDPRNPILVAGSGGATDDHGCSDLKIQRLDNGSWLGFYTGRKTGGPSQGTIHRVHGADPGQLIKDGQVISAPGSGWNADGNYSGQFWIDADKRLHMFSGNAVTGTGGIGLFYSDDLGQTFTAYASNPVAVAGASSDYDAAIGDVVQQVNDGDVIAITTGGDNLTFATNPPLRAQSMLITPARVVLPSRKGKFYLASAYTSVTATSILTNTVFSVLGRFRAYRLKRGATLEARQIFSESAAFNILSFVRIQGKTGTANDGKLHAWVRTPTAFTADMYSGPYVDDGAWHNFLLRRTATNAFELWLDGTLQVTDATTLGTDATATTKSVGNWDPGTGNPDSPMNGTVSDLITIIGTAVTWAQALAIIDGRTYPAGVSATIDFPTAGTENGDVATVEATGTTPSFVPFYVPPVIGRRRTRKGGMCWGLSSREWW